MLRLRFSALHGTLTSSLRLSSTASWVIFVRLSSVAWHIVILDIDVVLADCFQKHSGKRHRSLEMSTFLRRLAWLDNHRHFDGPGLVAQTDDFVSSLLDSATTRHPSEVSNLGEYRNTLSFIILDRLAECNGLNFPLHLNPSSEQNDPDAHTVPMSVPLPYEHYIDYRNRIPPSSCAVLISSVLIYL
jgi:hypothetical protein